MFPCNPDLAGSLVFADRLRLPGLHIVLAGMAVSVGLVVFVSQTDLFLEPLDSLPA
jgi:hypothetical protein